MNDEIYKLAEQVIESASKNKLTISTAESCTGGGIGAALTAIPGSSAGFKGGIIAYANSVKNSQLDVPPGMIHKYGAVSRHVARLMAENARKKLNTDIAVSVTGVAGPTGGSKDKPVGTVWIGLAHTGNETVVKHFLFKDKNRDSVRKETVSAALGMLKSAVS